jgi:hypothetical protein
MNRTRIALLGTLAELHKQPIHYDLVELARIVVETQPDLLCVEVERNDFERNDLSRASLEVREALIPLARRSDTVIVPIGAGSQDELRASGDGIGAVLIRMLNAALAAIQKTANDAHRVNSALVSHTCGLICHLEEHACGARGRRAWETTNEKMLTNIAAIAERDPQARILVAVQCRRKHWLEPKLRRRSDIELVNYWEL